LNWNGIAKRTFNERNRPEFLDGNPLGQIAEKTRQRVELGFAKIEKAIGARLHGKRDFRRMVGFQVKR
jgi:hypothetical protein